MRHDTARAPRPHGAGVAVGLTAVLVVLLAAFAWPASQLGPRDVPIAVAGPPGASAQVTHGLVAAAGPGAFDVRPVESRGAAVSAIKDRQVYGAIVVTPSGPRMLVASAASPLVAQLLTQVGTAMSSQHGGAAVTEDVVPLPPADPHGAVFSSGAFPLVIGGIAVGVALALLLPGRRQRLVTAAVVSLGAGLALAALMQFWLDALGGSYWANAGVYALAIGAMAVAVLGLHRLLGRVGLVLSAATILLLGNPLSGITSAPVLLPSGWSTLGQLLPPGAAGTALRSSAFFGGAGITAPLLVLLGWLLVGLALTAWPSRRPAVEMADRHSAVDASHAA